MNCELCKRELEAYHEGSLSEGISTQVKKHLETCTECSEMYFFENLANKVIKEEKGLQSNPFLATRVMASIEALDIKQNIPIYRRVLKPVFITVSIALAISLGILAGNGYKPTVSIEKIPIELTYIDDVTLESLELFAND